MAVGIRVGSIVDEVGAPSFLNSFFSSVAVLLEGGKPGSRFPVISGDFYAGEVQPSKIDQALSELKAIRLELGSYPPKAVVWDMDDRSKAPPWGDKISADITSMANYFVSSTGRDLFDLFIDAFEYAKKKGFPVRVVEF